MSNNIFSRKVGVYPTFRSKSVVTKSLKQILEGIKDPNDTLKNLIKYNRTLKKGEQAYEDVGEKLPLIQFNTIYEDGAAKEIGKGQLTGLMYLDADNFIDENHRAEFKAAVSNLDYIVAIWKSRGGKGFGLVAAVDNLTYSNFDDCYYLISSEINELTERGFEMDIACANHNRGNFMSYDPDIDIFTDGTKPFNFKQLGRTQTPKEGPITDFNNSSEAVAEAEQLLLAADWSNKGRYWARPGKPARSVSAIMNVDNKFDKRFKVYTPNSTLEPRMYSMFDLIMHFKFAGNYEETKKYVGCNNGPIAGKKATTKNESDNSDLVSEIVSKIEFEKAINCPEFPSECMPSTIRAMVEVYSAETAAPASYIYSTIMTALGAATQKGLYLQIMKSWQEYPILWTCITGAAGDGKTFPMKRILKTFIDKEKENSENFKDAKVAYEADIQEYEAMNVTDRKYADSEGRKPTQPARSTFLNTGGSTSEGIISALSNNNECGFTFSDEIMSMFNSLNSYKGGKGADQQVLLEMWSMGFSNKVLATKEAPTLTAPFMPVIGGTQILKIIPWLQKNAMDDGLMERFLWCVSTPKFEAPNGHDTSEQYLTEFDAVLNTIFSDFAPTSAKFGGELALKIAVDAKQTETDFKTKIRETKRLHFEAGDAKRSEIVAKMDIYCYRIATIVWLLDAYFEYGGAEYAPNLEVSKDQLERAIKIVTYFTGTINWMLGKMENSDEPHELAPRQLTEYKRKIAKQAFSMLPAKEKGKGYADIVAAVVNEVIGVSGKVNGTTIRGWKSKDKWN